MASTKQTTAGMGIDTIAALALLWFMLSACFMLMGGGDFGNFYMWQRVLTITGAMIVLMWGIIALPSRVLAQLILIGAGIFLWKVLV